MVVDAGEGCCIGREVGGEGKMRGDGGEEGGCGGREGVLWGWGCTRKGRVNGCLNGVLFERCD